MPFFKPCPARQSKFGAILGILVPNIANNILFIRVAGLFSIKAFLDSRSGAHYNVNDYMCNI